MNMRTSSLANNSFHAAARRRETISIRAFDHIGIPVSDISSSLEFWRQTLGLQISAVQPRAQRSCWLSVQKHSLHLFVPSEPIAQAVRTRPQQPRAQAGTFVVFQTNNLAQARLKLMSRGVKVKLSSIRFPRKEAALWLQDPDGYCIAIVERSSTDAKLSMKNEIVSSLAGLSLPVVTMSYALREFSRFLTLKPLSSSPGVSRMGVCAADGVKFIFRRAPLNALSHSSIGGQPPRQLHLAFLGATKRAEMIAKLRGKDTALDTVKYATQDGGACQLFVALTSCQLWIEIFQLARNIPADCNR